MKTVKPFEISKQYVWQAYQCVKNNKGAAGVEQQTMEEFERNLKDNLYKIWNRMSSGSYFPPAVKAVPIPKKSGGERILGIPTISDRIAQTVVKMVLEPLVEPIFDEDSYGYRPKKSAHDAIAVTRARCWKYDFVVEFDIKGLFDNIDHKLLMKALEKHCKCKWVLLYVQRWLKAPLQDKDGNIIMRDKGTPQGGVISPILANLFLHYVFDAWVRREMPSVAFCRYADDGLLHCQSQEQAEYVLQVIRQRFQECGLTIHPDKSGIIYCKDNNRRDEYERISFDFLGYSFRPRRCVNKQGMVHPNFLPAISNNSKKAIIQTIRSWHIQLKNDKSLSELSEMFKAELRGWYNYYGQFYPSAMHNIWKHLNWYLERWVRRKYKKLAWHKRRAREYLNRLANLNPEAFIHWKLGIYPKAKMVGAV
ncbi:group II intron reverse transcriptase/maturase [Candidatus Tisiphia endosymbiont of Temnostethus pusillus]|uniref:group II intron reverse transcriptase/maturase n=2 Tax=Candidatus Tisiphia endosymbiont of Temnostethus pusillus TaxID=3139335 RepID=UPI0035C88000